MAEANSGVSGMAWVLSGAERTPLHCADFCGSAGDLACVRLAPCSGVDWGDWFSEYTVGLDCPRLGLRPPSRGTS